MIGKVAIENNNRSKYYAPTHKQRVENNNPSFKSGGVAAMGLQVIQLCEKYPMVNVAFIDFFSAILPRTIVESWTNIYAGGEALRRESSGLIVNCMIPGVITMGAAYGINNLIMPKKSNLSSCWASKNLIDYTSEVYSKSTSNDKVKDTFVEIIKNLEGFDGECKVLNDNKHSFKELLTKEEIENYAQKLKKLSVSDKSNKEIHREVQKITKEISEKTHIYANAALKSDNKSIKVSNITNLLEDNVKYLREFQKVEKDVNILDFAKKGKKLVKSKSAIGMAIILPLAASVQSINRWWTEKRSGVKGAPIYDDYGQENSLTDASKDLKSKEGLVKQKIISVASMLGVMFLSMAKKPSLNMLEFKGLFPTMDQARIISGTTFSSRMLVADDKNELAEATVRDITTFIGLYFLGDYVAKISASIKQKRKGIELLNETKPLEKDANVFKKIMHWLKNVNLKSTEEITSKTAKKLKLEGLEPDKKQLEIIKKEIKEGINHRSYCQMANLGVSLILLGVIVPLATRLRTKKKSEAAKKAQVDSSSEIVSINSNKAVKLATVS